MSNNKTDYKQIANSNFNDVMETYIPKQVNVSEDTKTPKKAPKNSVKKDIIVDNQISDSYKYKNGTDKTKNYTITFKIDADIEDYLKNISYISFIENKLKGIDATEYVNNLIREDMLKTLKVDASEQNPNVWISAYDKYKSNKGL